LKYSFENTRLNLIAGHALLGTLLAFFEVSKIVSTVLIVLAIVWIVKSKRSDKIAIYCASYLVGAEVFFRMTKGFVFYETGKYGVFLFLLLGAIMGKNTNRPNVIFIVYILLLLLGIVYTSVPAGVSIRNSIVFNLSGPVLLGLCSFFFYYRRIRLSELNTILFMMVLPIISVVFYLYFRTPDIEELVFGGVANYKASGGFGPNQVATVLGFGVFIVSYFMIAKVKFTGFYYLDGLILIYMVYRGLLTFSRGGMVTSFIALIFLIIFYGLSQKNNIKFFTKIISFSILFFVGVWIYTSGVTGGMLENRYTGKNASGVAKKDFTSGRLAIFNEQLKSFYNNPIVGIGVGNGKYARLENDSNITAASHNEIGRLIEEHGLIGIFSLLLILFIPFRLYFEQTHLQRAFMISFFLFWLLTSSHSAMRIAFPSFIYGLCLINVRQDE
jgi:hypothetical protein